MTRILLPLIAVIMLGLAPEASPAAGEALFDVEARMAELKKPEFAPAREACLFADAKPGDFPKPVSELKETKEYGSDNAAETFAWYVMVNGGRALAGDEDAAKKLQEVLLAWAKAGALEKSKESHDPYYAIKRTMTAVVPNYTVVAGRFSDAERRTVEGWIDRLVRRIDHKFDGDVDRNNHRYLADALLMMWGSYTGDKKLYAQGVARYREALGQARADGSLPLESRRGSRAVWYMRHALTSLTVMAEVASLSGDSLYDMQAGDRSIDLILSHFLNGAESLLATLPYAAENVIPGAEKDYMARDLSLLHRRGHGRLYMAFAEAYLAHNGDGFASRRLRQLMDQTSFKERPLVDEYAGGNTTCFWWVPGKDKE